MTKVFHRSLLLLLPFTYTLQSRCFLSNESTSYVHTSSSIQTTYLLLLVVLFMVYRWRIYMLNELIINMDTMGRERKWWWGMEGKRFSLRCYFKALSCAIFLVSISMLYSDVFSSSILYDNIHQNDSYVLSFTESSLLLFSLPIIKRVCHHMHVCILTAQYSYLEVFLLVNWT